MNLPLMNLNERVLSVLGCRYVDDVLIDAPYKVTREMITSLNISEVVHGTDSDEILKDKALGKEERYERYSYPIASDIFSTLQSPCNFKVANILRRIRRNEDAFQSKFDRKMLAETQFYEHKREEANKIKTGRSNVA